MRWINSAACILAAIGPVASGAEASSLKVSPVRLTLTGSAPIQTMTVETGAERTRVQLRVFSWTQQNGEDVFAETRDIIVNPPLFQIEPGGRQVARLGLRVAAGPVEKSFRAFLEEIPDQRQSTPGVVRTLLRISIPIFVPPVQSVGKIVWKAAPAQSGKIALTISNQGSVHVQINRVSLKRSGGAALLKKDMSLYVLPNTTQTLILPADGVVKPGEKLKLTAITDQADVTADIVAEPPGP